MAQVEQVVSPTQTGPSVCAPFVTAQVTISPEQNSMRESAQLSAERRRFDPFVCAKEAYEAMHGGLAGVGVDQERLFRALAGITPEQMQRVRECYTNYTKRNGAAGRDLDKDVVGELSSSFSRDTTNLDLQRGKALLACEAEAANRAQAHKAALEIVKIIQSGWPDSATRGTQLASQYCGDPRYLRAEIQRCSGMTPEELSRDFSREDRQIFVGTVNGTRQQELASAAVGKTGQQTLVDRCQAYVAGDGTKVDGDRIINELGRLTESQLGNIRKQLSPSDPAGFDKVFLAKFWGRRHKDAELVLQGLPEDPFAREFELAKRACVMAERERPQATAAAGPGAYGQPRAAARSLSGDLVDLAGDKGVRLDEHRRQLTQLVTELQKENKLSLEQFKRMCELSRWVRADVDSYRGAVDSLSNTAATVGATVAGTIAIAGTAGMATPVVAGTVILSSAGGGLAGKVLIQGKEYEADNIAPDLLAYGTDGIILLVAPGSKLIGRSAKSAIAKVGEKAATGLLDGGAGGAVSGGMRTATDPTTWQDGFLEGISKVGTSMKEQALVGAGTQVVVKGALVAGKGALVTGGKAIRALRAEQAVGAGIQEGGPALGYVDPLKHQPALAQQVARLVGSEDFNLGELKSIPGPNGTKIDVCIRQQQYTDAAGQVQMARVVTCPPEVFDDLRAQFGKQCASRTENGFAVRASKDSMEGAYVILPAPSALGGDALTEAMVHGSAKLPKADALAWRMKVAHELAHLSGGNEYAAVKASLAVLRAEGIGDGPISVEEVMRILGKAQAANEVSPKTYNLSVDEARGELRQGISYMVQAEPERMTKLKSEVSSLTGREQVEILGGRANAPLFQAAGKAGVEHAEKLVPKGTIKDPLSDPPQVRLAAGRGYASASQMVEGVDPQTGGKVTLKYRWHSALDADAPSSPECVVEMRSGGADYRLAKLNPNLPVQSPENDAVATLLAAARRTPGQDINVGDVTVKSASSDSVWVKTKHNESNQVGKFSSDRRLNAAIGDAAHIPYVPDEMVEGAISNIEDLPKLKMLFNIVRAAPGARRE